MSGVSEALTILHELVEDDSLSRSLKERLEKIIWHLRSDNKIGVDRAISDIEEIMDVNNLETFVRTGLWDVVSVLERA